MVEFREIAMGRAMRRDFMAKAEKAREKREEIIRDALRRGDSSFYPQVFRDIARRSSRAMVSASASKT